METVVDATIPDDRFVLAETIERIPEVEFEFVRFAIHSSSRTSPFLWGSADRPDRLDAALRSDPSTERVSRLSESDGRGLYSITWNARAARLIDGVAEIEGSVLDVRRTTDRWALRFLFPDRATASETFQAWRDEGVDATLSRISTLSCREDTALGLSATQHSTIAKAFRTDYYSVPRGTTLEELARDFDVSHQALSERLRRGHSRLVERMLSESAPPVERRP